MNSVRAFHTVIAAIARPSNIATRTTTGMRGKATGASLENISRSGSSGAAEQDETLLDLGLFDAGFAHVGGKVVPAQFHLLGNAADAAGLVPQEHPCLASP